MEVATARSLKQFPLQKSYFQSQDNASPRFERLQELFEEPITKVFYSVYQMLFKVLLFLTNTCKENIH